ncbi:MAG: HPr(Ser) kinase/phosphatase [Verrucomicrobiota bacterium JB022]|nr:HPr(Ser) kinase/phosphatase [Verrucomicrobiota bacterium JB022]
MPPRPQPKIPESITVQKFYEGLKDALKLTVVQGHAGLDRLIRDKSLNRPALALTGYFKTFGHKRVQLFGAGEMMYLRDLPDERQHEVLLEMADRQIPCLLITRNYQPTLAMEKMAEVRGIPLLRSPLNSRDVANAATVWLEHEFAPRIAEHGTLMDIKGIGTLIRGKSGVGKSECALALIERGYSLVADDMVYIRLINENELQGRSSELNRGYMECRGLGIVNIAEMFGIRAVRLSKNINLVVTFEEWKPGMDEDRTGLEQHIFDILGQPVPHVILPVRPGRDLARLVEVAAMIQALKQIGHDPAKMFNEQLISYMAKQTPGA